MSCDTPRWPQGRLATGVAVIVLALAALVLLRPHQDTFTALDHSGYRLMGKAFISGRGIHEVDTVLKALPRQIRNGVMLLPSMAERNTRDRSFLVRSLDSCETEPFFYPLLPMCALFFDRVTRGYGFDYFVPVCGCVLFFSMVFAGRRNGGLPGIALAAVLFFGSPVPTWCFRGFYAESVGAMLVGVVVLSWLGSAQSRPLSWWECLALGFAASFHPVMLVPAAMVLACSLIATEQRFRQVLSNGVSFLAGIVPLLLMTELICSPYGDFRPGSFVFNYHVSASHRMAMIFSVVGMVSCLLLVIARPFGVKLAARYQNGAGRAGWLALACLAFLPLLYATLAWPQKAYVLQGLHELWNGLRWGYGVLLVGLAILALIQDSWRSRFVVAGVLAISPVFLYLKGAESMGLWSQRRLLPLLVLGGCAILPSCASALGRMVSRGGRWDGWLKVGICILLIAGGASNAIRWPSPYWVRVEKGADEWVGQIKHEIGSRLAFFDYYPYSVPFAVDGKSRVIGLGEKANKVLPGIMNWISVKAKQEEVLVVTAYENPGLEDGVELHEIGMRSVSLAHVDAREALPAETIRRDIEVHIMRAVPLASGQTGSCVNKIMDGGPLALRGPWGRPLVILSPEGRKLSAMWSREGSGVVGPVPKPGGAVHVTICGTAGQQFPQTLLIYPPWCTNGVPILVGTQYSEAEVQVVRNDAKDVFAGSTGVYRLCAKCPYDPATEHISGFNKDLGALIHSIRICAQ